MSRQKFYSGGKRSRTWVVKLEFDFPSKLKDEVCSWEG